MYSLHPFFIRIFSISICPKKINNLDGTNSYVIQILIWQKMIILVVGMKDYWKRHFDLDLKPLCNLRILWRLSPAFKLEDWHRLFLFVWLRCPRWGSLYFYSFSDLPTLIRILNVKYLQKHLNTFGITLQLVSFRTFTSTSQMMLRFSSSTPKSIFMKRKCSLLHQRYEKEK